MKNAVCLTFILLIHFISFSQSYQQTSTGIKALIDSFNIEIQFYNASTVRVIKYPSANIFKKKSLCVITQPEQIHFEVIKSGGKISLISDKVKVDIDTHNGKISFFSREGNKSLLSEKEAGASFTPFEDVGANSYKVSQLFSLGKDEAIYGLGQQQEGKMIQRNITLDMVQGNTDDYVPFFVSVKRYGIFWDNYSPTVFEDKPEFTSFTSSVGNGIDYYFLFGANADNTIAEMRNLTGQVPMFPLWTFGYWQSRERYKSQMEVVDVVKKYRELHVPLDGIIQDWQYWGSNYHWNAMDFLNPQYSNPQKMIDDVHNLNAHMAISIWASFGPQTKQYRELDKIGAFINIKTWPEPGLDNRSPEEYPSGVKVYDVYNPQARDIFWKYLNKGIFSLGMDAWWMDSTEPDHFGIQDSDYNEKTYLGSFRKVRNAFPLMTVGGVYDHQRKQTSQKRVFILTRSAFAGQQRYGANTWSGDVVASWENLRNQIAAGLNFSLSAIPYWNSDIGGFFLGEYPRHLKDPEYRELYARWLQFGTFCPMMRSHGTDAPREIYQFGKRGDKVYDVIEKFINLRYRLLPYIYSTAWEVTNGQSTMMRGLVMDFPDDVKALDINDEFMFGKSFLVSPVTQSMYSKSGFDGKDSVRVEDFSSVKQKQTYLPAGTRWIDFWSGKKFEGGKAIQKDAPLDIIPLYVKSGSIIPIGPNVQYAEEQKWNDLEIRIYPGADGNFVLYEDENDSYNYEKGNYSTIHFHWNNKNHTLTIANRKGSFPGMLTSRTFTIVLVNESKGKGDKMSSSVDAKVEYSGKLTSIKL